MGSKIKKEKLFWNQHDKTNTKIGGRCLMDKFGLYGSPLQYSAGLYGAVQYDAVQYSVL